MNNNKILVEFLMLNKGCVLLLQLFNKFLKVLVNLRRYNKRYKGFSNWKRDSKIFSICLLFI